MPRKSHLTHTRHRFGGAWTEEKLGLLQKYLGFYTQALKDQGFELVYIDTFAGTGRCQVKDAFGDHEIHGSARIALDCSPAFSRYHFIEKKKKHVDELLKLTEWHANGQRAQVNRYKAEDFLPAVLREYDWEATRGVLFLDPYGLECTWPMLEDIASTKALDVFFLVSLSGLFRQAAINEQKVDSGKAARLTRFLGTEEWRDALYVKRQDTLFGDDPTVLRDSGYLGILQFTTTRLKTLFSYVAEPRVLRGNNGAPLFALYFAVSNPSPKAQALASRVSRDIFSKV